MMLYPPITKLPASPPTRKMMGPVVARRARQIAAEAEATGEHLTEKPVTLAINEVAEGDYRANSIDTTIEEDNED